MGCNLARAAGWRAAGWRARAQGEPRPSRSRRRSALAVVARGARKEKEARGEERRAGQSRAESTIFSDRATHVGGACSGRVRTRDLHTPHLLPSPEPKLRRAVRSRDLRLYKREQTADRRQLPWLLLLPSPCRRDRRRPDGPAAMTTTTPIAAAPDADRGGTTPRCRRERSNGNSVDTVHGPRCLLATTKRSTERHQGGN